MHCGIKVINEKVLVKRDVQPDFSKGGIFIHEQAKGKMNWGTVVAKGEGKLLENGTLLPIPLEIGDKVIFRLHGGHDMTIDDVKHVLLKMDEIVAIVEE